MILQLCHDLMCPPREAESGTGANTCGGCRDTWWQPFGFVAIFHKFLIANVLDIPSSSFVIALVRCKVSSTSLISCFLNSNLWRPFALVIVRFLSIAQEDGAYRNGGSSQIGFSELVWWTVMDLPDSNILNLPWLLGSRHFIHRGWDTCGKAWFSHSDWLDNLESKWHMWDLTIQGQECFFFNSFRLSALLSGFVRFLWDCQMVSSNFSQVPSELRSSMRPSEGKLLKRFTGGWTGGQCRLCCPWWTKEWCKQESETLEHQSNNVSR